MEFPALLPQPHEYWDYKNAYHIQTEMLFEVNLVLILEREIICN
jgi:hypothetical protein